MLPRILENQQLRFNGVAILSSGCRMDSDSDDSKSTSDAQSTSSFNDTRSVTSTMSKAREKQVCPSCKKDYEARSLFKHIRTFHPDYFSSIRIVYKEDKLDELIKANAPMPVEWIVINDFDEEETMIIWGCLACNTAFTTEQNGILHCNDNDKRKKIQCKKEHNKQLKIIKKQEEQERKEKEKKISKQRLQWANRTPKEIHLSIQEMITFYNKQWETVSAKVIQYVQSMNRIYSETYDCDKYVFTPIPLPAFQDNKVNMEKEERRMERELTNWQSTYKDALRLFWGDWKIVSDGDYESLERTIYWGRSI